MYKFETESFSVRSKTYYSLIEAMADAEKTCAEVKENVLLWQMPSNQFRREAFVFVHWCMYGAFIYTPDGITFEKG